MGEADKDALRVDFDRAVKLQFRRSTISSDGGLLAYRGLDEAFALTVMADDVLMDLRTGSNIQHIPVIMASIGWGRPPSRSQMEMSV